MFDTRDSEGPLLPETEHGCEVHYFSSCFKSADSIPGVRIGGPAPAPATIPAHNKIETAALLNAEYDLSRPGTYTVVGYVHILDENGHDAGTFKTNKIKIAVQ